MQSNGNMNINMNILVLSGSPKGENIASYMAQVNHPNERGHAVVAQEALKWFCPQENE